MLFRSASPELRRRQVQDRSQQICSAIGTAKPSPDQLDEVVTLARASIRYPADGRLMGDWKTGAQLVVDGAGQRIVDGKVEQRPQNGALCINCHAMDPRDVNAGNLGPSLTGYGRSRGATDAAVRYTYDKVYNAWSVLPCSSMPRMGTNGFLTPEQVTHVVA